MAVFRPVDTIVECVFVHEFHEPEIIRPPGQDFSGMRIGRKDLPMRQTGHRRITAILADIFFRAIGIAMIVLEPDRAVDEDQYPVARAIVVHMQGNMNPLVLAGHTMGNQFTTTNRLSVIVGDIRNSSRKSLAAKPLQLLPKSLLFRWQMI